MKFSFIWLFLTIGLSVQNIGFAEEFAHGLQYTYLVESAIKHVDEEKGKHWIYGPLHSLNDKSDFVPFFENFSITKDGYSESGLPPEKWVDIASHLFDLKQKVVQMNFVDIKPDASKGITEGFKFQQTHVTQWQFLMALAYKLSKDPSYQLRKNPSHFSNGPSFMTVRIEGKKFIMQPNHPVENVKLNDAEGKDFGVKDFINVLNELAESNHPLIYVLVPGHQPGDIYDLPTSEEWQFVASGRGLMPDMTDAEYKTFLADKAWYSGNPKTNNITHTVAALNPFMIDNGDGTSVAIYDLVGLLWVWTNSPHPNFADRFVVRGGCFGNPAENLRPAFVFDGWPGNPFRLIGFRVVVRTALVAL